MDEYKVVNEVRRTYYYPDGNVMPYGSVVTVKVSKSGTHYLKSVYPDGVVELHIVAPGWRSITIDPGAKRDWTF